jgi:hypothetical protein
MKTSKGKIIHFATRIWKSIQLKTLQKCVPDQKKKIQPHQRFKLCKPQKHKTPEPSTGPKKELPKNHVIKKCNQETMGSKHAIKNHASKRCNQKLCHQNKQSQSMPSKNAIKKHAIKKCNQETCNLWLGMKDTWAKSVRTHETESLQYSCTAICLLVELAGERKKKKKNAL